MNESLANLLYEIYTTWSPVMSTIMLIMIAVFISVFIISGIIFGIVQSRMYVKDNNESTKATWDDFITEK